MRVALLIALSTFSVLALAPAKEAKKKAPELAAPAVAKAETKPAPTPAKAASAATGIIGNKDSKVYHKTDCKMAAKMKAENKTTFASSAEAEKAGYKACKNCCK